MTIRNSIQLVASLIMMLMFISISAQKPYKGAEVYSINEVLYGKFEMSMKMVKGSGMVSTFFTYKGDSYLEGVFWEEIDIEVLGKNDAKVLSTNIIIDGVSGDLIMDEEVILLEYSLADDFHTYTLEWTPDSIVWYIDGIMLRRETDKVVDTLLSPQGYRFNAWISCEPLWVGDLDPGDLPQYQYIDWIEYYSYNDGEFTFEWRDDFDTFDGSRWSKANWTFDCNEVDFISENATIEDGKLVLAITDPNLQNTAVRNHNTADLLEVVVMHPPGKIRLKLPKTGNYKVDVFDLQGRTVIVNEFSGDNYDIYCDDLLPGLYFLTVQSKDLSVMEKIYIR